MFTCLEEVTAKPAVWSVYTADVLWTNSYISKQMLSYHLNTSVNLASRVPSIIDESVNWLVEKFQLDGHSKIIDFGCGPGLYTQRFKEKGIGSVVGLDFSNNSLQYARDQARFTRLNIEYHSVDYLEYGDDRKYNLISLIMCDLCALNPSQRSKLFSIFKSLLAEDGVIALDVYTVNRFDTQNESTALSKNTMDRFWSSEDYWCLQSAFKYEKHHVTLDKYTIFQKGSEWSVYNWLQHFTIESLEVELAKHGLAIQSVFNDLRGEPLSLGDEMAVIISHA